MSIIDYIIIVGLLLSIIGSCVATLLQHKVTNQMLRDIEQLKQEINKVRGE